MEHQDVPQAAQRQGGVFTRRQALDEGWTERQIQRRLAAGTWMTVAGCGFAARTSPTVFQYATAALLTWPTGVISHRTAAALHGFPVDHPPGADVTTAAGHRSRRSLRAHALPLSPDDAVVRGRLTLTTPTRTAFDCLAAMEIEEGLDLWAWLTTRRVVRREDLGHAVRLRHRWRGTPRLARLMEITRSGAVSAAEHRLHVLLRSADIHGWIAGAPVHDRQGVIGVVDLLFAEQRVVVEVDGFRAHGDRRSFVTDRRRQNRLVVAGYVILRFTWDDLAGRPHHVISEIRAALTGCDRRFHPLGG